MCSDTGVGGLGVEEGGLEEGADGGKGGVGRAEEVGFGGAEEGEAEGPGGGGEGVQFGEEGEEELDCDAGFWFGEGDGWGTGRLGRGGW